MAEIISIAQKHEIRNKYIFVNRPVALHTDDGIMLRYPCIGLYEKETGVAIGFPAYERWYLKLAETEQQASQTLNKRAYNVCSFLNFLLWNTNCRTINDVTLDNLRDFLLDFRHFSDGKDRSPDGWERGIEDVYNFLLSYIEYNKDTQQFRFRPEQIFNIDVVTDRKTGRKSIIRRYNKLHVKAPRKTTKKNRYLLKQHLELILEAAKKYDPMLTFGIALQAYAGLREGEVVNLTRSSIKTIYGGYGTLRALEVNITESAPFVVSWEGSSEFGSIKVPRTQRVYDDFAQTAYELFQEHESILFSFGADDSPDAPLFLNRWGNPMSVATYCGRIKDLFYDHFLPSLIRLTDAENLWAINGPFIEKWQNREDPITGDILSGEYPGAHMFRHWFTMYLMCTAKLSNDEIMKWRGDSNPNSMLDYIHINTDMINLYREAVYTVQRSILREIL